MILIKSLILYLNEQVGKYFHLEAELSFFSEVLFVSICNILGYNLTLWLWVNRSCVHSNCSTKRIQKNQDNFRPKVCFKKTDTLYIGGNLYKVCPFFETDLMYIVTVKENFQKC